MTLHQPIATDRSAVRMVELVGAFSYALDITEGQPEGHALRCAWIGGHVGQAIGLGPAEREELHYALLLKDLGCSSNAARICELYQTDDLAFKRGFKTIGTSLAATLHFVFSRTARGTSVRRRAGAIGNILRNGDAVAQELILSRCTRGADIARDLGLSEQVCSGIYHLDEHWDGSGRPQGLSGRSIPLFSRIALLAQIADVFQMQFGREAAIDEVRRRSGGWLDPELTIAFERLSSRKEFWEALASPSLEALVSARVGTIASRPADEDFLDSIAAAFGQVVDAKSPYTGGHSARVAAYADGLSQRLGMDPGRRRWLRRAALLHDIGKLGVSNAILDKPAKLNEGEWAVMRDHAVQTQAILVRVEALADLAPIAAAHHERLDGAGYPLHLTDDAITLETRIITICDFYDALTADRPYRSAMTSRDALEIIGGEAGKAVDGRCFDALREMVL